MDINSKVLMRTDLSTAQMKCSVCLLREVKLIVYICRVLVTLSKPETGCCHLGTESRIVLGDLAFLVPPKGIPTQVRVS